jgi:hypothetical protein
LHTAPHLEKNFQRYEIEGGCIILGSGVSARAITPDTQTPALNECLPLNPYALSVLPIQLTDTGRPQPPARHAKYINKLLTQESGLNAKFFFFKDL